ncbi:hypothetical protein SDC9_94640 [bioreactor metagenome]|uniref:Uncharacterized protein n=1 Tax=bioreactor metagenome TaxID=1076179 RepID=A0A645A402_9ZZZZ
MENHLVAIFQVFDLRKWAGQTIGIIYMAGQYAITLVGGVGRSVQPTGVITQPGNIPAGFTLRNAGDIRADALAGDFQTKCIRNGIRQCSRLSRQVRHHTRRKTGVGDGQTRQRDGQIR